MSIKPLVRSETCSTDKVIHFLFVIVTMYLILMFIHNRWNVEIRDGNLISVQSRSSYTFRYIISYWEYLKNNIANKMFWCTLDILFLYENI